MNPLPLYHRFKNFSWTADLARRCYKFNTRRQFSQFLGILFAFGTFPYARAEKAPDWGELSGNAQPALFTLIRKLDASQVAHVSGFFITKEGHALCDLRAVSDNALPTELWIEKQKHSVSRITILKVFRFQPVVLVKFDHQPKKWLSLSDQALPLNSEVAFLMPNQIPPRHVGPVLAKWKQRSVGRVDLTFSDSLSIGSGPPRRDSQGLSLSTCSPLIDRKGLVRGVNNGITPGPGQTFLLAAPADSLVDEIEKAIQESREIPFPITQEYNPIDPVIMDPVYNAALIDFMRGKKEKALIAIDQVIKAHPKSSSGYQMKADLLFALKKKEEFRALYEELSKRGDSGPLKQIDLLGLKAILPPEVRGDQTPAIDTFKELIKLVPPDYPVPWINLGRCYAVRAGQTGDPRDLIEAEKSFKAAMAVNPENILLLSIYESFLNTSKRWAEADAIGERIYELEAIYREK